jgi:spoIIIJ-associated protein
MPDFEHLTPRLEEFLKQLLAAAKFDLRFKVRRVDPDPNDPESPEIMVDFSGGDTDILLARGGELLEALEDVAIRVLRLETAERGKVCFDSNEYRSMRAYELRLTAETAAERALSSGAPFALSPMNSRDRRIIHLALKDNPAVRTESDGFGSQRKIVIFPVAKTVGQK